MMTDGQSAPGDEARDLSADLCDLLQEQIASVREGNLSRVERLGVEADAVIAKIMQRGPEGSFVVEARRSGLERLYEELALALQAECDDVRGRLKQLRQVRRAFGAYRGRAEHV